MLAQRQLKLGDPRYKRPTMSVDAAKGILDCTEDDILAMVEEQGALVAWNIAIPGAERRELRLLTQSVSEYLRDNPDHSDCFHTTICPDYAIQLVLPGHNKPFVTGLEVQRCLNCGSTHVINLVSAKALTTLGPWRRGPGGSPNISRESFAAFLKSRLL